MTKIRTWWSAVLTCAVILGIFQPFTAGRSAPLADEGPPADPETQPFRLYVPFIYSIHPIYIQPEPAPQPGAVPGLGIQSNPNWMPLEIMVEPAAAYWTRNNGLIWSMVEPTLGERNWNTQGGLERELRHHAEMGFQSVLIVRGTPAYAQKVPGYSCGPVKEEEFAAFAHFMYDAVRRYSSPPYNVRFWEIWNEPDIDPVLAPPEAEYGCWGDQNDPYYGGTYYAKMLQVVYPAIKNANPSAQVLVGGLLLGCDPRYPDNCMYYRQQDKPSLYLEGILRGGGGPYFDGVSFHAYDGWLNSPGKYWNSGWMSDWKTTGPVAIAKARFLKETLGRYGFADKYLINTEAAMLIDGDRCKSECEAGKSYYIPALFAASIAEGIVGTIYYSLDAHWKHVYLYDDPQTPTAAYSAYTVAWEQLKNVKFLREVKTDDAKLRIYEFQRGTNRLWVLWAQDANQHKLSLPGTVVSILDPLGQAVSVGADGKLVVTLMPLYLEWKP